MAKRPKVIMKLVDKKGECNCHHGHKVGDTFDFDTERGSLCSMAMHAAFPYVDILRYGGTIPLSKTYGKINFCCPDPDVINVFEIEVKNKVFIKKIKKCFTLDFYVNPTNMKP